ncbi:MAG: histidine kinase [Devosiaceae bacterium]|nr:histidine kinase [Devosiaceae bacterium]
MKKIWKNLNLTQQFGLTAGLVMVTGMLVIGFWVAEEIERGVTLNAGISSALYMDTYVAPLAVDLRDSDTLSIGPVLALDEVFLAPLIVERLLAVQIWKPDGTIVYADDLAIMGQNMDPSPGLIAASKGEVFSEYFARGELSEIHGNPVDVPVLEIYSPIRLPWSDEVVAVLEFYENASSVEHTLSAARTRSWLVVGASTLVMTLALLGIVHSGSILIDRQKRELRKGAKENANLARRVEKASGKSAELSEQHLRRVSADLHDGPAQLVSLAALRIGGLPLAKNDKKTEKEVADISKALDDAMREIRNICRGLSLPEIENQSLSEILKSVVDSHTARTGMAVQRDIEEISVELKPHEKICIYRFFQEGLNNAFRHGGGKDQRVEVNRVDSSGIRFAVLNSFNGKNKASNARDVTEMGLGLTGLAKRVEALGGQFGFECSVEDGARLQMILNIGAEK